jgi:hypothetical protein
MRRTAVVVAALLAAATGAGIDQADARKATAGERTAIVKAWEKRLGIDESRVCKRTWIIRVAQSKPRLASITGNSRLRMRHDCLVGDGYGMMRRPNAKSTRWRVLYMTSGDAPSCRLTPPHVSRQLGFGGECSR